MIVIWTNFSLFLPSAIYNRLFFIFYLSERIKILKKLNLFVEGTFLIGLFYKSLSKKNL